MTTHLGGSASSIKVGKVAHGLMMMTWSPDPAPDEPAFEAMKASIDSVPSGCKMVINSGEFYGINPKTANLELVSRFFEKYPEYADRAFLSVKGGLVLDTMSPDASEEGLRRSIDNIIEKLRGKKRLDLFQCARVDKKHPIEETIAILAKYVKDGKFDHIGMSECSAETLRKAHAVHPIAAVEIEVSMWSYEEETKKVIATAKELGIAVLGYSPLGRGFLTGNIKTQDDIKGMLTHMPRFQGDALKQNLAFVEALKGIAAKKSITPAQLAIAWVSALGSHVIPLPGSSRAKRTEENLAAASIHLSESDLKEIQEMMETNEIVGGRYAEAHSSALWG